MGAGDGAGDGTGRPPLSTSLRPRRHCVDLFLDFVDIFRELLMILGMTEVGDGPPGMAGGGGDTNLPLGGGGDGGHGAGSDCPPLLLQKKKKEKK